MQRRVNKTVRSIQKKKITDLSEALHLITDGDCIATTGAGVIGYPEYLSKGIEDHFLKYGYPKDLTVLAAGGHGAGDERCDGRFAHKGLLKKYVCTHMASLPTVADMIENEEIEGYVLPQGVANQLYRATAARQAGIITKIGLGTYIDPRKDGGKLNSISDMNLSKVIEIDGEEWLFYSALPINVALIRATTSDEEGNLSVEKEGLKLEILECALAAKACGGKVIAQVERIATKGSIDPEDVVVPGQLVDVAVVCNDTENYHRQTQNIIYSPYISGELKSARSSTMHYDHELSAMDIIHRRAAMELYPGATINIGVGMGAGIGRIADEEGLTRTFSFTIEMGAFGGIPTFPPDFGASVGATAYVSPSAMFDFYHGGGVDISFLGAAQVDRMGNVNVSKFGGRPTGHGGFIDISQSSKKVVFVSYFRSKGLMLNVADGLVTILNEGELQKYVERVDQVTFNAELAAQQAKPVIYITERAVFELTKKGIVLIEIAPGIDIHKDILSKVSFEINVSNDVKEMDMRIFRRGKMRLSGERKQH